MKIFKVWTLSKRMMRRRFMTANTRCFKLSTISSNSSKIRTYSRVMVSICSERSAKSPTSSSWKSIQKLATSYWKDSYTWSCRIALRLRIWCKISPTKRKWISERLANSWKTSMRANAYMLHKNNVTKALLNSSLSTSSFLLKSSASLNLKLRP